MYDVDRCLSVRGGPSPLGVFQVGGLIFGCQGCDRIDIMDNLELSLTDDVVRGTETLSGSNLKNWNT